MASMTRWDPMREMTTMRNWMDRFFDESLSGGHFWGDRVTNYGLALDVAENDESYIVRAAIPGIDPENMDITLNNDVLTIQGNTQSESEERDERYHLRELRYGSFRRSIVLPSAVDREHIDATCDNGILTLHIPKSTESQPRRIAINAGRTIDGNEGKRSSKQQSAAGNGGQRSSQQRSGAQESSAGSQSGASSSEIGKVGASANPSPTPHRKMADGESGANSNDGQSQPLTDEQSGGGANKRGARNR